MQFNHPPPNSQNKSWGWGGKEAAEETWEVNRGHQGDRVLRRSHPSASEPHVEGMTFLPGLKVTGPLEGASLTEVEAYPVMVSALRNPCDSESWI